MDRRLVRIARIIGAAVGALIGVIALQVVRLHRLDFLPAHPGFYVNRVARPATGDEIGSPLRLLLFGDSTTAGVGVDRPEDSLPSLIAQRLADDRHRRVHVTSYGWAGARVADLIRDQLPRAHGPLRAGDTEPVLPSADVVVVVIGANDATHQTRPAAFRADLRRTLAIIITAAPSAEVVLAGIPRFRGALPQIGVLIWLTDQYARILRRVGRAEAARAGVRYADLARDVPPRVRSLDEILSVDRFHPSRAGYALWADVICEALASRGEPAEPVLARTGPPAIA